MGRSIALVGLLATATWPNDIRGTNRFRRSRARTALTLLARRVVPVAAASLQAYWLAGPILFADAAPTTAIRSRTRRTPYASRDFFLARWTLHAIAPATLRLFAIVSRMNPVAGTIAAAIELYVAPADRAC
jgi:hypothetical protein